jgi:catechol 2,3-dioxygenase-like lactoylglutathione lyase family enzyme
MIVGIDHIEIIVRDVDEFVEFYQKLGFELLRWTEHHGRSAELKLPGEGQPIFEIHTLINDENPGINHISFRCEDAMAAHEALVAEGIKVDRPPHPSPATGRRNILLRDPDGWRVQLSEAKRTDYKRQDM